MRVAVVYQDVGCRVFAGIQTFQLTVQVRYITIYPFSGLYFKCRRMGMKLGQYIQYFLMIFLGRLLSDLFRLVGLKMDQQAGRI